MARGVKAKARSEFILSFVSIYLLININIGEAIWLEVPSSGTKCVSEDIKQNIVVIADFSVINDDNHLDTVPNISARVTSPYGNNLHQQENVTHGQFAFTTTEAGNYLACFWVDENYKGSKGVTVGLDWRTGIAAKDWESVARKEKIEGIELELRKLEGAVDAIHHNLIYLKTSASVPLKSLQMKLAKREMRATSCSCMREAEMREVSETTNGRVAWFSIMSISICIAVSVMQVLHLKRYFQKKKLI